MNSLKLYYFRWKKSSVQTIRVCSILILLLMFFERPGGTWTNIPALVDGFYSF